MSKLNHTFAQGYAFQFGLPVYKGGRYLSQILKRYAESGFPKDTINDKQLIIEIAQQQGIQPNSLKQSIQRYINAGWKYGFSSKWQYFVGWNADTPPDVNTAICLLCESVDDYITTHCGREK